MAIRKTAAEQPPSILPSPADDREIVLLCLVGMSPAVLTETVWALAHEPEPVLPHRVIAVTTRPGRDKLLASLIDSGRWEALRSQLVAEGLPAAPRLRFGPVADSIRVIPKADRSGDLDDLVTPADSEAAADFIQEQVRNFTADAATHLVAGLAGGRKTMSAILAMSMMFLGRDADRLCHVLVSPPFDSPALQPPFLFPTDPPETHRLRLPGGGTREISSSDARIWLADVPFAPLRGLWERDLKRAGSGFMALVRRFRSQVLAAPVSPTWIEIDPHHGAVTVDGADVRLGPAEFGVFLLLALRRLCGHEPVHGYTKALMDLILPFLDDPIVQDVHQSGWADKFEQRFSEFRDRTDDPTAVSDASEHVRKVVSRMKNRFREALGDATLAASIFERSKGTLGLAVPPETLHVVPADRDPKLRDGAKPSEAPSARRGNRSQASSRARRGID